ncbi:hypothetical protein Leryth_014911 [Lithospermum erythrorhizon]|nr:hypothetical protein Leryth_014911 [Lithospermum erythrorhizon]
MYKLIFMLSAHILNLQLLFALYQELMIRSSIQVSSIYCYGTPWIKILGKIYAEITIQVGKLSGLFTKYINSI